MKANDKNILTMGIETSCDETACSVVADGRRVLSNVISSQADFHAAYGGVVPELASRMHVEGIVPVIRQALADAEVSWKDISVLCVTKGPGLVGALLIGLSAAKAISAVKDIPLIGVHHIEGHIAANYISDPDLKPPFIALVASGGHSQIIHVKTYTDFTILGTTRDDAAGEAFDKIARVLGLGYPGGPKLEKLAQGGDPDKYIFPRTKFSGSLDFSFSGVKTAALNQINRLNMQDGNWSKEDFAASYQKEIAEVLTLHTIRAASLTGCKRICLAGGVSANTSLRSSMQSQGEKEGVIVSFPPPVFCTDNGAMIASAGYFRYINGAKKETLDLNAEPSLSFAAK